MAVGASRDHDKTKQNGRSHNDTTATPETPKPLQYRDSFVGRVF